eukprot:m.14881 g.14881  ORF g.14881 m.14881 type:complete len:494 (-) comp3211_c0_seq1:244-1725(-)
MATPYCVPGAALLWIGVVVLSVHCANGRDSTAPPAKCASVMNAYCNGPNLQECIGKVKAKGGTVPLVALDDRSASSSDNAWRCYSPTCLDATNTHYTNTSCTLYCSEDSALEDVLDNCTDPTPPPVAKVIQINATDVWGTKHATDCQQIRTPELVVTPSRVLLFGQCRNGHVNATTNLHGLGDDMREDVIVSIAWEGQSWNPNTYTALTPQGYSVGVGVYDSQRSTVILQYQSFTDSNPYVGNTLWQSMSTDDGVTWSDAVNITHAVAPCNRGPGGQVCGAAGSRLQTVSGRIVFSGHSGPGGGICVWYSDDGGKTYNTTAGGGTNGALLITGNEQSIADLGNGSLYMNGRGMAFPFAGHRASYWSHDNGASWSSGQEARALTEPNSFGCDGALVSTLADVKAGGSAPPRVFFSEPAGPGTRKTLRVWCSYDAGVTWGRYVEINTGAVAAYSALAVVPTSPTNSTPALLVVWEQAPTMLSHVLPLDDWCPYHP